MYKLWFIVISLTFLRIISFYILAPQLESGQDITYEGRFRREQEALIGSYDVDLKETIEIGSNVTVSGELICYESFNCARGRIANPTVLKVKTDFISPLYHSSSILRNRTKEVYETALNRQEADLLSGIVLGGSDLDRKFKTAISYVGLSHIVAASGMNVTLVAGLVLALLSVTSVNRRHVTVLGIGLIVFYMFIAGLAPAIVRAGIMATLVLVGGFWGRRTNPYYSLILTGVLMLWVYPGLLFDYGFLLSFASMMGQITLITWDIELPILLKFIGELFLQNVFAIGFTLPIVLYGFHSFSLISMVSNLLVVWTVEPLMIAGLVAGIIGLAIQDVANVILIPAEILLDYFLWVVKSLSSEKFLLKLESFTLPMAAGYYLVLISILMVFKRNQSVS